jgi:3-oxoacyl-[acyl-carrier-protein] synthase II
MRSANDRVVVTGLGMVTPLGIGHPAFWEGVLAARSTARTLSGTGDGGSHPSFACPVDEGELRWEEFVPNRKALKLMGRATRFAMVASALALADSGLGSNGRDPRRCAVAHGAGGVGLHDQDYLDAMMALTAEMRKNNGLDLVELATRFMNPLTPLKILPNNTAAQIAIAHDFRGENVTICTACTSGTQAIGEALRLLREDRADVVLAGGSDAMINPMGLVAFGMLGVLSKRVSDPQHASRPFDRDRDGFVMGEGSAMLVLERESHARRRGATVLAEIGGYGCCSDAYRITDEREDGSGCIQAMRAALDDAGVRPEEIQYVNAHGTGTRMNDRTETLAMRQVFGAHAEKLALSSTKSQIGHLVAAAGAAEAGACVLALRHQTMPPTINYVTPDPECDLDVVPNTPRKARLDTILSNSFGFGGQNACLVFHRGETA